MVLSVPAHGIEREHVKEVRRSRGASEIIGVRA